MKNPYAPPPRPETDLQHKARKLAAWHEQQAQQQAAWHRETAAAWRALIDIEQPMPAPGSFSVRG